MGAYSRAGGMLVAERRCSAGSTIAIVRTQGNCLAFNATHSSTASVSLRSEIEHEHAGGRRVGGRVANVR